MDIRSDFTVPAGQDEVWALFCDIPSLVTLLPGCSDVQQLDDTHYRAKMVNRVKFMTIKFDVEGELVDAVGNHHMEAQMTGKPVALAGFFRTTLSVDLSPVSESETRVEYTMTASMTGRLASFGELLMRPVVEGTANEFTQNIINHFQQVAQS